MYESFYGLKSKPFSMLPDPCFLYLSKKHLTALTLLEYGLMNHVGFCVISGETGAGKTTLLRKLLENIEDTITVGMITNTHQSFGELLDWVLSAFGIHKSGHSKVEMHQQFIDFLLQEYARGKTCLLIVDEAQNMSTSTLEELRMLSNVNSEGDQLLQVILSGQPALRETLRDPGLMQFAQRIGVDFHLDALNESETCGYIQHRLLTSGAERDIFTPEACHLIYQYSGGTPRLINLLSDTALVYGFADHEEVITADIVEEMVQERMQDSVVPLYNRASAGRSADDPTVIEFPWIVPQGGTAGLKPKADSATGKETKSPKQGSSEKKTPLTTDESAPGTSKSGQGATQAEAVAEPLVTSNKDASAAPRKHPGNASRDRETPSRDAAGNHAKNQSVAETVSTAVPRSSPTSPVFAERAGKDKSSFKRVSEPDKTENASGLKIWAIGAVGLVAIAAALYFGVGPQQSEMGANRSAEQDLPEHVRQQLDELQHMKGEIARLQEMRLREQEALEQAEAMKKERDEALARAREEEARRAREAAEKEAARREKAALAAAAAAAEKALKAAEEAKKLAETQRRQEARLREERRKLEDQRKKAELEQLRLDAERKQAELEQRRLEQRRLEEQKRLAEKRARAEWEARQNAEAEKLKAAAAATADKEDKKESQFVTDPCSSPSAKFLSTCR